MTWQDSYGNRHDLDYVLERGGTEDARGVPVAFVESAWRRYTKHSKNKVQEIEAAVLPIALTFARHQPFCGAVLSGDFTRNALTQLESKGFSVFHIPYQSILEAFREIGIDASSVDRITTEDEFQRKIAQWEALSQPATTEKFLKALYRLHAAMTWIGIDIEYAPKYPVAGSPQFALQDASNTAGLWTVRFTAQLRSFGAPYFRAPVRRRAID